MIRVIILLVLTASVAMADVWPSWLSPAQGSYDRGNQALSGAVERLTVAVGPEAWTNYITTNIWASYFSQASKLRASKAMLKAAVDTGIWTRPATNWTPEAAQTVTASNLLAWCGAPAGWWTNHPYVNIAAVSNGWRFLPDVESNLVWVGYIKDSMESTNTIEGFYTGTGATWSAACGDAAAGVSFPPSFSTNVYPGEYSLVFKNADVGYYGVWFLVNQGSLYFSLPYDRLTNYASGVSVWNLQYADDGGSTIFDAQGCNVSTSAWVQVLAETYPAGQIKSGYFTLFPTNYTTPPNYTPEPDLGVALGWDIGYGNGKNSWNVLHKYNATTNGFKWFR